MKKALALVTLIFASMLTFSTVFAAETETTATETDISENTTAVDAGSTVPHPLTPYQASGYDLFTGDINESFSMMGVAYNYGAAPSGYIANRYAIYNLHSLFDTVKFKVGLIDGKGSPSATLHIYMDGILYDDIVLNDEMITREIELPVSGVKQLLLDTISGGGDTFYAIADVTGFGGHIYGDKVMTVAPSETEEGLYTYVCEVCGNKKEEAIPAIAECKPLLVPYTVTNYSQFTEYNPEQYFLTMGDKHYLGLYSDNFTSNKTALFNLGGEMDSVTFSLGHMDNKYESNGNLYIYLDAAAEPYDIIPIDGRMSDITVTIPTKGIIQLKLEIILESDAFFGIYDMSYERSAPKAHNYIETVILDATPTSTGIMTYTCADCGTAYNAVIPAN